MPYPTKLLTTYAPDFCWMTITDLLTMLEYVDEDIEQNSLAACLYRLVKSGKFKKKEWPAFILSPNKAGPPPSLYLKVIK